MNEMNRGTKHKREATSPDIVNKLYFVDRSSEFTGELPVKMAAQVINSLPESLHSPENRSPGSETEFQFKPIDMDVLKKACGKKAPDFVPGLITAITSILRADMLEFRKEIKDVIAANNYWMSFAEEMTQGWQGMQIQMSKLTDRVTKLEEENNRLRQRDNQLESYSRRSNLIFDGVPETEGEDLNKWLNEFLNQKLRLAMNPKLERIHRLGRPRIPIEGRKTRPRPIIVRFSYFQDREKIWSAPKYMLRGSGIFINEDFPPEVQTIRRKLQPVAAECRRKGYVFTKVVGDKLKFQNSMYQINELNKMPKELRDGSRWSESQVTFFGELCKASNFNSAPFHHDGVFYENSEKMIFHKKALKFNDKDSAAKILNLKDPREIKRVGEAIECDIDEWNNCIEELILPGLIDKFRSNPSSLEWLKSTGNRRLVEAAGERERIWGCGLKLSAENIHITDYPGKNLQGRMLEKVRDALCS